MSKKIHPTLWGMWLIMLVYGVVLQLILLGIGKQVRYASVGAWAGVALAMICAGLMLWSITAALNKQETRITTRYYKSYALRLLLVLAVFGALLIFRWGSVGTAFIGFFSLKLSAYLQPVLKKNDWTK